MDVGVIFCDGPPVSGCIQGQRPADRCADSLRAAGSVVRMYIHVLIYLVIKHSLFSREEIMHKSLYGSKKLTEIAATPLEPFHCSQPTNKIMMQ